MYKLPQLILVGGSGRNIGKTWLSCQLISYLSKTQEVIGIKISTHPHPSTDGLELLAGDDSNWIVYAETNTTSTKDSALFLAAGASKVYYMQVSSDAYLPQIVEWILLNLDKTKPIVCESASLGLIVEPGQAYFIEGETKGKDCLWNFIYHKLTSVQGEVQNFESIKLPN